MRTVVESYVGLWVIMLMLMLGIAFTSINMNVSQARKIASDIKAEVQASNGKIVDSTDILTGGGTATLESNGYEYNYEIQRQSLVDLDKKEDSESYIYNSIYKIKLEYKYAVPLFGTQIYPIVTFAY